MKVLTTNELLCLTRAELCELRRDLTSQLAELPDGSIERYDALKTLANIQLVLARPELARRPGGPRPPEPCTAWQSVAAARAAATAARREGAKEETYSIWGCRAGGVATGGAEPQEVALQQESAAARLAFLLRLRRCGKRSSRRRRWSCRNPC